MRLARPSTAGQKEGQVRMHAVAAGTTEKRALMNGTTVLSLHVILPLVVKWAAARQDER